MDIQKELNTHPFIIKAAEEVWFDNGMVNRFEPLEQKVSTLNKWLSIQPTIFIENIEFELSNLTDDQLHTVCCGEESEAENLASKYLMDFLTAIFNEEYETQAVPDGFVLVPREPTDKMIMAAHEHHEGEAYLPHSLYTAMIEAAEDSSQ